MRFSRIHNHQNRYDSQAGSLVDAVFFRRLAGRGEPSDPVGGMAGFGAGSAVPVVSVSAGALLGCASPAERFRRHIENKLHYVRDETMGEDKCRIRSGSAPQILAGIRNAAITLLWALEIDNIAEVLRANAWHPQRLFAKLGITNN
jgi:hypothetical protein